MFARCIVAGNCREIAGFALAAQGKHEHDVGFGDVTIQGHVAMRAATDHQLAFAVGDGAADQGAVLQYVERLDDFMNTLVGMRNPVPGKVIENAIEIISDLRRQFDARHGWRGLGQRGLRAAGRRAVLPARRLSR